MLDRWTLKKRLVTTFVTILALAAVLISVGLVSTSQLIEKVKWNDHTHRVMQQSEITVRVVLNRGPAATTVWTCDLSHDYVSINADYRS